MTLGDDRPDEAKSCTWNSVTDQPRNPEPNLVSDQVARALSKLGISYEYEQKLPSKDNPNDFRLPDFTVSYEGDTFYWEHLGMLSVPSYKEAWDRKRQ
jgi:hypothetical protein